jgi:hypothetical protein
LARQLARRRQRERLAGIVVVCIGVVVLAVAVFALREPSGHVSNVAARNGVSNVAKQSAAPTHPRPSATTPTGGHATSDSQSEGRVKEVPLVVLNNTTIHGLAAQAAQRFEAGGWTVTDYGNLRNDILSTCAYYEDGNAAAKAAAEALQAQYPTIKRVKPKFPELPAGPVVVVLTPDYSSA